MPKNAERRKAIRLKVDCPTVVEAVAAIDMPLPASLAAVYERVQPAADYIGKPTPFVLRDLSTNGAFLEGPALPLLSRVKFVFALENFGEVKVIGWTMWRRRTTCMVPGKAGPVELLSGVGVLFESMDLDARVEISRRTLPA
jgi:hypothetical protein